MKTTVGKPNGGKLRHFLFTFMGTEDDGKGAVMEQEFFCFKLTLGVVEKARQNAIRWLKNEKNIEVAGLNIMNSIELEDEYDEEKGGE